MMSKDKDEPDLFDDLPGYPDSPGYKEGDTSREAAEDMALRAGTLRALAYAFLLEHPYHTADEVAEALSESPLAIRPRISELRVMGLIVCDGRGKNRSGKAAHLWKPTPAEEAA
jgi:predicted ArsR family transcriptional regulator